MMGLIGHTQIVRMFTSFLFDVQTNVLQIHMNILTISITDNIDVKNKMIKNQQ